MRFIKVILLICFIPIVLSGCSAAKAKTAYGGVGSELMNDRVTIGPSGSYEECIELDQGAFFDYDFDASDFVNFNIHYHADDGVHEPVNNKGVKFGKGRVDPSTHLFYSTQQEHYCMMWDNLNEESVQVSFKYAIGQKEESMHHMQH